jgi:hypothetical protein
MTSTKTTSSAQGLKKTPPKEFDLVMLGDRTTGNPVDDERGPELGPRRAWSPPARRAIVRGRRGSDV